MSADIPSGLCASLAVTPRTEPFVLLLRHADRELFQPGEPGNQVELTAIGEARARALAQHEIMKSSREVWGEHSPVRRCVSTAAHLGISAVPNRLLGDPGAFVTDTERAGEAFLHLGTETIVRSHLGGHPWSFLRSKEDGARLLLGHIEASLASRRGTGVLISHDTIVIPVIAWTTGERFDDRWLDPLDGLVITRASASALRVIWQGKTFNIEL